jgi:hypothetical protein
MANATTASMLSPVLDAFGHSLAVAFSDWHMAFVNLLLPTFGEFLTYTLMQYILLKIVGVSICWVFEYAENNGYWQQYRIQPDRKLSKEYIADEWDKFIGKQAVIGFFLVVLPMYWVSWKVHGFIKGSSVGVGVDPLETELGWGWGLWWRIAAAVYIDDTVLFVMHVGGAEKGPSGIEKGSDDECLSRHPFRSSFIRLRGSSGFRISFNNFRFCLISRLAPFKPARRSQSSFRIANRLRAKL